MSNNNLKEASKWFIRANLPKNNKYDIVFIKSLDKDFIINDAIIEIKDELFLENKQYFRCIIDRVINNILYPFSQFKEFINNKDYNKSNLVNSFFLEFINEIRIDLIAFQKYKGSRAYLLNRLQAEVKLAKKKRTKLDILLRLIKYLLWNITLKNYNKAISNVKYNNYLLDEFLVRNNIIFNKENITELLNISKNNQDYLINNAIFFKLVALIINKSNIKLVKKEEKRDWVNDFENFLNKSKLAKKDRLNIEQNSKNSKQEYNNDSIDRNNSQKKNELNSKLQEIEKEENNLESKKLQKIKKSKDIDNIGKNNRKNIKQSLSKVSNINSKDFKYKVYTKLYDQTIEASKLPTSIEEVTKNRIVIEDNIDRLRYYSKKNLVKLKNKLLIKSKRSFDYDMSYGEINNKQLVKLIIDPNYINYYKQVKESKCKDTIVTLVVDNSGSMRGNAIMLSVICIELIGNLLEKAGIKLEILAFTTREWKGGRSRILWEKNHSIKNPGRLSDILHIIYKSSNESWRKSKKYLPIMLENDRLKENIDGEALEWAFKRLARKKESRKILFMISDGVPMDDSTISANSSNILEKHLKETINFIENKTNIELFGIGVGHKLDRFYKNAIYVDIVQNLANILYNKLAKLI